MIIPHIPTHRLGPDWPHSAGLTASRALEARQRHGPNDIVEAVEHPWWALARDTARDPMIWFFAGTSALYGIVGQVAEAATLLGAIEPLVLMLMIHIPLVITAALIPLAGYPLLYLPTHIVWLEMLIHPTALLVFQGLPSPDGFGPVDRSRTVRFFSRSEWLLIVVVGVLVTVLVTLGYVRSFETGDVDHGRAMALGVLTLSSAVLTAALSRLRTTASRAIVAGTIGLSLVLTQVQSLATALHLEPLHADDWAIAGIGSLLVGSLPLLFDYVRSMRRHAGQGGRPGPRILPASAPSVGKS